MLWCRPPPAIRHRQRPVSSSPLQPFQEGRECVCAMLPPYALDTLFCGPVICGGRKKQRVRPHSILKVLPIANCQFVDRPLSGIPDRLQRSVPRVQSLIRRLNPTVQRLGPCTSPLQPIVPSVGRMEDRLATKGTSSWSCSLADRRLWLVPGHIQLRSGHDRRVGGLEANWLVVISSCV